MGSHQSTVGQSRMKIAAVALWALVAVRGDVTHHSTISHGGVVVATGHHAPHLGPAVALAPHPVAHHAVHPAPLVAHHGAHHAVHAAPVVPHHAVHAAPVVAHPVPLVPHHAVHHAVHPAPYAPEPAYHPAPAYHPEPYHEEKPKDYEFGYDVHGYDEYGNPNVHSRTEQRDGYNVKGQYRVELPDCRVQIVDYFVDEYKQYHADVKYEGVPCPDKSLIKHHKDGYHAPPPPAYAPAPAYPAPAPVPAYAPAPVPAYAPAPVPAYHA